MVYGSRSFGSHSAYSFWYIMGSKGITLAANILFNAYLRNLETCYKLLPRQMYLDMDIRSGGFGMEAEMTAKVLNRGIRPYEVPISTGRAAARRARRWPGPTAWRRSGSSAANACAAQSGSAGPGSRAYSETVRHSCHSAPSRHGRSTGE